MYVVEIAFVRHRRGKICEMENAVASLLAAWLHDGHICGSEWQVLHSSQNYVARVLAPARDAFKLSRYSKYVKSSLENLAKVSLSQPQIKFLGLDSTESNVCDCKNPPLLLLYTRWLRIGSPLRCGECRDDIPLYRIPKFPSGEYFEILGWEMDYQACYTLQMGCATGEKFGLREMGELNSSLSQRGLEICREIEKLTGTPTYYYLRRYNGRSKKSERARLCPSCIGAWILPEKWHDKFDFRCDKCHLLSNIAYQTSN